MKLGITSSDGEIFQHFGATPEFTVYNIEGGKIVSSKKVSTNGTGHEALVDILADLEINALICGGIGGGARNAVFNAGITLFPGVKGNCDTAAQAFLDGTLAFNPETMCDHQGHEHSCSGHCHH
ncbi:MAG TPA: hypothetical protein O0X39_02320 [Methanocorpusculum sp.]|nr:hypothetical protein [Methanocorpusculum sp.]